MTFFNPISDRPDWEHLINLMRQVHDDLSRYDSDLYPAVAAREGASIQNLDEAELRLGYRLDPLYRQFLLHADGWPHFLMDIELLGTSDLGDGQLWRQSAEIIDVAYEVLEGPFLPRRSDLCVIAAGEHTATLYTIWNSGPRTQGGAPVIGFPDIDEPYPNFLTFLEHIYSWKTNKLATYRQSDNGY